MKRALFFFLIAPVLLAGTLAHGAGKGKTLDDLKKLQITCFVPGWLPEGYHLKSVTIDYSDTEGLDDPKAKGYPAYALEYGNGKKGKFTIESARIGIGELKPELLRQFLVFRNPDHQTVCLRVRRNFGGLERGLCRQRFFQFEDPAPNPDGILPF